MPRVYPQEMVEDIRLDGLPVNWNTFDIGQFSRNGTWGQTSKSSIDRDVKKVCARGLTLFHIA